MQKQYHMFYIQLVANLCGIEPFARAVQHSYVIRRMRYREGNGRLMINGEWV